MLDSAPIEFGHRGFIDRLADAALTGSPSTRRRVFSSNSMTIVIDLLLSSDAVITYPVASTDFFAARGIQRLQIEQLGKAKPVGIYVLDERRADRNIMELQDRVRAAAIREGQQG